jgi:hypothetical protein
MLAAACGSASVPPTAGPTGPGVSAAADQPIGDSCLVGKWVTQNVDDPSFFSIEGQVVPLSGQQGLVYTFAGDGTEVDDFTTSQPLVGVYHGQTLSWIERGVATSHVHATGSSATETGGSTQLTTAVYLGGVLLSQPGIAFSPVTFTYRCAATTLEIQNPGGGTRLTFKRG